MRVEYDCGCKSMVIGGLADDMAKLPATLCRKHGPELARQEVIKKMHGDAEEIERKGMSEWLLGHTGKAHELWDVSRSLRVAANFVDGVQGT